jgi:hypothetical protein
MTGAAGRVRGELARWVGWWRLVNRYCPCCKSSPPRPRCPVCRGSYDYGAHASGLGGPLTDTEREVWRARWIGAGMPVTPPPHGFPDELEQV